MLKKNQALNYSLVFLMLGAMITINGCATYRPCDSQLMPHGIQAAPPRECRVDGCTLAPSLDFLHCCDEHDIRYWAGGTIDERFEADRDLRKCMAAADHGALANLYYLGVRFGGTPYLPTPWRWGFGWDYPHGYDTSPDTEALSCNSPLPAD